MPVSHRARLVGIAAAALLAAGALGWLLTRPATSGASSAAEPTAAAAAPSLAGAAAPARPADLDGFASPESGREPGAGGRRAATPAESVAPTLWLAGTVVDEGGTPLEDASVTIGFEGTFRRARTASDGTFEVHGPAAGPDARADVSVLASDGHWDEGRHARARVTLGEVDRVLEAPARSRVRWSVVGDVELGGFASGFRLHRVGAEAIPWRPLVQDGEGVAYGLDAGSYELRFEVELGTPLETEPLARFELDEGQQLELGPLFLERSIDWRRVVLVVDGQPLPPATVVEVSRAGWPRAAGERFLRIVTDPGGALSLPVPRGAGDFPPLGLVVLRGDDAPPWVGSLVDVRSGATVALMPAPASEGEPAGAESPPPGAGQR